MEDSLAWMAGERMFTMDMAGGIRWLGYAGKIFGGWLRRPSIMVPPDNQQRHHLPACSPGFVSLAFGQCQ